MRRILKIKDNNVPTKRTDGDEPDRNQKNKNYNIFPIKDACFIASIYGTIGFLWVILSDEVLIKFFRDAKHYQQAQTYKGWFYVIINVIVLFLLVKQRSVRMKKALSDLNRIYEELQNTCSELVSMERELSDQKVFNEKIFTESHVIMGTWDENGIIKRLNPYALELFGYCEEEIIGRNWRDFLSGENKSEMVEVYELIRKGNHIKNHESQFITHDKRRLDIIWNSGLLKYNKNTEILSVGTDITERKLLEEKLKEAAYYDNLTGLYNRNMIEEEAKKRIQNNEEFALIYMDIDNFKQVNDTLGHTAGDKFLQYLADKLRNTIKCNQRIARLCGDEFAIIYPFANQEDIERELQILTNDFGKSWEIENHEFFLTVSTGVSIYPKDCSDLITLFRNADIAMFKAKREGKGRYVFYSEDIMQLYAENNKLANKLKYALDNSELILNYQPQYNLETGKITGLEVLVRWIHDNKFIPPSKFIPIAEETGQIYEIEYWIIESSLRQKKIFETMGNYDMTISINLSSKSLCSDINFNNLEKIFLSYDVDYSHIIVEITETAIISDIHFAVNRLKKLRDLGVKIALDDFGTGYSSLTHLKELPIDIVKLDRSFIQSIEEDGKDAMIIKSILYLALDLNYEVVAEGIETEGQLEFLKKYKCQTGQGFLLSRPVPIESIVF
ncbi:EAL domain-containing protein [Anaerocolumna sedimenticola]|uniref:EAL domain-containing protein n=1 Tax=Anaerocolumna sedimenticola TaxID=2696063 RepID=A0A6P1TKR5_9FIRM|nr:EAL domain-containing protein [Anaerocolumna sedimenticola]QHQ61654.1 EAL domain-containing protein [Anaerocolumna sedimenticola]